MVTSIRSRSIACCAAVFSVEEANWAPALRLPETLSTTRRQPIPARSLMTPSVWKDVFYENTGGLCSGKALLYFAQNLFRKCCLTYLYYDFAVAEFPGDFLCVGQGSPFQGHHSTDECLQRACVDL